MSRPGRPYRMVRRAAQVDDTRRRITEAAVRLHTTVGPSATSFAAVAEAAGVTRLTLYRHFATPEELFAACMTHWRAEHAPPDVDAWRRLRSFEARVRRAVYEVYGWYAENAADLYPLYRDAAFIPASTHHARRENLERMTEAILADRNERASKPLLAAIGHVLSFWTWRSLAVEQGCAMSEAVGLASRFVLAAGTRPPRLRRRARGDA